MGSIPINLPPVDFSHLLNAIPMGILILDSHRRVVFCNRALEAITGLSTSDAVGLSCYNVMRSRTCLSQCPALSPTAKQETICTESDLINRDHRYLPVRLTVSPLQDAQGKFCGFIETVEDLRLIKEYDNTVSHAYSFGDIIGQSPEMDKLFRILPVIAQSDSSVLVTGETGTGKDLLAEIIHQASDRAKGPFVKINCGALPETLLESELFGHTKGAFTGAFENKQGRFHLAHNGTLFLTEIGDLPLQLQTKLLTFLDDRVVFPLGSTKGFAANVRIIAATHRNLEEMVRQGRFRQDLFFRLNVLHLNIPPLRDRQGDIRLLLDHFLHHFAEKMNRKIGGFTPRAIKLLTAYTYPGNVRELSNMIEYAVNVCRETKISPKHLPASILDPEITILEAGPLALSPDTAGTEKNMADNWLRMEKQMIMEAMVKARGNRSRAAGIMGCSRSTLWRKMKKYRLEQT